MGWGNLDIQKLINKHNLNNMIEIIESPSDKKLYKLYQHCEALIFPSIYEGFGLPVIEALSLNKPVLLSNIEVFKEIAGRNALYFNPYRSNSIKNQILKFYLNKKTKEKLIQNNKIINIKKIFSWKKTSSIFDKKINFYDKK